MGRRLPVRIRVTLAFAGVMAVVLAAPGLFVYLRLGDELDEAIDQGLRSRAADARAGGLGDQGFPRVPPPPGAILDSTPAVRGRPLLSERELHRAQHGTVITQRALP